MTKKNDLTIVIKKNCNLCFLLRSLKPPKSLKQFKGYNLGVLNGSEAHAKQ